MKHPATGFYRLVYGKRTYLMHWLWVSGCVWILAWSLYRMLNPSTETPPPLSLVIQEPHFYSLTSEHNPYTISSQAIEYLASKKIAFSHLLAEHTVRGQKMMVRSKKGIWDNRSKTLTLEKDVHIKDHAGRSIKTHRADFFQRTNEIHSHRPTHGRSPEGSFHAQGFSWTEKTLQLKGPVTMVLKAQHAAKTS